MIKKIAIRPEYFNWYILALFYPIILSFFVFCIFSYYLNGSIIFPEQDYSTKDSLQLALVITWGSLGEEIGWRGFMLPLLNKKNSLLKSSVITGLFWGIWHMYFFTGIHIFLIYLLLTCEFSVVMSWIQSKVDGNIIPAIISHSSFNICTLLFFGELIIEEDSYTLFLIFTTIVVLFAPLCLFVIKTLKKNDNFT